MSNTAKKVTDMKVDRDEIEGMAQRFVPPEDIQKSLGLTPKQFQRYIWVHYKKKVPDWWEWFAAQGRAIILQAQFEQASKGNVRMLIWLGKQQLGQRDQVEMLHKAKLEAAQEDKTPEGYEILTPAGATVVLDGPQKVAQPHDEKPIVEAILVEEEKAKELPPPAPTPAASEKTVNAFPEEN